MLPGSLMSDWPPLMLGLTEEAPGIFCKVWEGMRKERTSTEMLSFIFFLGSGLLDPTRRRWRVPRRGRQRVISKDKVENLVESSPSFSSWPLVMRWWCDALLLFRCWWRGIALHWRSKDLVSIDWIRLTVQIQHEIGDFFSLQTLRHSSISKLGSGCSEMPLPIADWGGSGQRRGWRSRSFGLAVGECEWQKGEWVRVESEREEREMSSSSLLPNLGF